MNHSVRTFALALPLLASLAPGSLPRRDGSDAVARIAESTAQPTRGRKTRVVILGIVEHSAQLIGEPNGPGVLASFLSMVNPEAICIERPPEQAARGDYYEFTYEVQGIILPYVASHPTAVCPIDWMPSVDDQRLVFGFDLDVPPEVRPRSGFQTFTTFADSSLLHVDLFGADDT